MTLEENRSQVERTIDYRITTEGGKVQRERLIQWKPTWETDPNPQPDSTSYEVKVVGLSKSIENQNLLQQGANSKSFDYVVKITYNNPSIPSKTETMSYSDLKDNYPREFIDFLTSKVHLEINE